MYGLTRQQVKTRFKVAIPVSVVLIIVMIAMQYFPNVGEGMTWGGIIISIVIGIFVWPFYLTGLFVNWKVQWVEPFKKTSRVVAKAPIMFWAYVFILMLFFMIACFKLYGIGFKAVIFSLQGD